MSRECKLCKKDPTPKLMWLGGATVVKPCGLVRDGQSWRGVEVSMVGCPESEWQKGYADALLDVNGKGDIK